MKNIKVSEIQNLLSKFIEQQIAVIGDLMLDQYIFGKVDRISPEAPVPVVSVVYENCVPGGAANVALNLARMQASALLSGVVGEDQEGKILINTLHQDHIDTSLIIPVNTKSTTKKVRIMGHNQNLLRIDYEDVTDLDKIHSDLLFEMITKSIQSDFIILSDYAKGTLSPELICNLIKWAIDTDKKIVVDPKPAHKEYYKNCYLITPNKKEAQEMTGIILNGKENLSACGNKLMQELNCLVVITLGEEGMAVFDNNADIRLIPTRAREVFDVSGAGDTATAALTLGLSSGASLWQAAEIANIAAGIKVSKIGTHPVSLEEIMQFILDNA